MTGPLKYFQDKHVYDRTEESGELHPTVKAQKSQSVMIYA